MPVRDRVRLVSTPSGLTIGTKWKRTSSGTPNLSRRSSWAMASTDERFSRPWMEACIITSYFASGSPTTAAKTLLPFTLRPISLTVSRPGNSSASEFRSAHSSE